MHVQTVRRHTLLNRTVVPVLVTGQHSRSIGHRSKWVRVRLEHNLLGAVACRVLSILLSTA